MGIRIKERSGRITEVHPKLASLLIKQGRATLAPQTVNLSQAVYDKPKEEPVKKPKKEKIKPESEADTKRKRGRPKKYETRELTADK